MTLAQIAPSEPFCRSVEESTTASRTLTNAILRTTQVYTGTAQGNWTLPAASSFTDGQHFIVLNGTSNKQLTLTHAGSDTILRNGNVTTLTLGPGESGVFESNGVDEFTFTGTSLRSTPSEPGNNAFVLREESGRKRCITGNITLAAVNAIGATGSGSIDTGFDLPAGASVSMATLFAPTAAAAVSALNVAFSAGSTTAAEITNACNNTLANRADYSTGFLNTSVQNLLVEFVATGGDLDTVTGLDDGIDFVIEYVEPPFTI